MFKKKHRNRTEQPPTPLQEIERSLPASPEELGRLSQKCARVAEVAREKSRYIYGFDTEQVGGTTRISAFNGSNVSVVELTRDGDAWRIWTYDTQRGGDVSVLKVHEAISEPDAPQKDLEVAAVLDEGAHGLYVAGKPMGYAAAAPLGAETCENYIQSMNYFLKAAGERTPETIALDAGRLATASRLRNMT
jgi:hypothetical protein